jgi:hypothetical protein
MCTQRDNSSELGRLITIYLLPSSSQSSIRQLAELGRGKNKSLELYGIQESVTVHFCAVTFLASRLE